MSFNSLLRAITWVRNNLGVIAFSAVAWVFCGYGLGSLCEANHWPVPYLLGYVGGAWLVVEVAVIATWLARD